MLVRRFVATDEIRNLELLGPVSESGFGPVADIKTPADADIVILMLLGPDGLKPLKLLLPHQLYVEQLSKMLLDHPNATQIVALPARSRDQIALLASWQRVDVVRCEAEKFTANRPAESEVSGG